MDCLPPPYATTSPTTKSPYEQDEKASSTTTMAGSYMYATQLPAFDTPRKYSSRLRSLLEQRSSSRGMYLTLHIPGNSNSCRLISIESASTDNSEDSASDCSDSISEKSIYITEGKNNGRGLTEKTPLLSGLSAGIPLVEDLEAGTIGISNSRKSSRKNGGSVKKIKCRRDPRYRSRRRSLDRDSSASSWLAFFGLLMLVFTVVCAAGVFIAWATGFTTGRLAAAQAAGMGPGTLSGHYVTTGVTTGVSVTAGATAADTEALIQSSEKKDKVKRGNSRVWRSHRRALEQFPRETAGNAEGLIDDVVF